MTKQELEKLSETIENIAKYFEEKPFTENVKLLKDNFDVNTIKMPNHYLKAIDELDEILRETRFLFISSVLNKVCVEENTLYLFKTKFKASMEYDGVLKKDGNFYLRDEDFNYREIFTSNEFKQFIDDLYWELYEEN
jgi:hypothetical protein